MYYNETYLEIAADVINIYFNKLQDFEKENVAIEILYRYDKLFTERYFAISKPLFNLCQHDVFKKVYSTKEITYETLNLLLDDIEKHGMYQGASSMYD